MLLVVAVASGIFLANWIIENQREKMSNTIELLLPKELELATIQGNSLIANNPPITERPISNAMILGGSKNLPCPIELQCVQYLKNKGLNIQGNAKDIVSNSDVPVLFGGVLLRNGIYGHIAYIEAIDRENNRIYVSEMNWEGCGIVSYRWIDLNDPTIRGYIAP